jgi:hypothetical protein
MPGAQVSCVDEDISKKPYLTTSDNSTFVLIINDYSLNTNRSRGVSIYILGYTLHILISLQCKIKAFWMCAEQ